MNNESVALDMCAVTFLPGEIIIEILSYRTKILFKEKSDRFEEKFSRLSKIENYLCHPLLDDFDAQLNSRLVVQARFYSDAIDHRVRYLFRCERCASAAEEMRKPYRACSDLCAWTERDFQSNEEVGFRNSLTLRGMGGKLDRATGHCLDSFAPYVDERWFQDCTLFVDAWECAM